MRTATLLLVMLLLTSFAYASDPFGATDTLGSFTIMDNTSADSITAALHTSNCQDVTFIITTTGFDSSASSTPIVQASTDGSTWFAVISATAITSSTVSFVHFSIYTGTGNTATGSIFPYMRIKFDKTAGTGHEGIVCEYYAQCTQVN